MSASLKTDASSESEGKRRRRDDHPAEVGVVMTAAVGETISKANQGSEKDGKTAIEM